MNFWMKTISRILFISALCTAIIFCSGYIHFVIFLPVCLLLVNIKYLLLLYSLTSSALVPQPFLLTPPFWSFPFKGEKRPFRDSLFWWSLLRPSKHFHFFFFRLTFSVISVILWIPLYFLSYCHYFYFYCHSVLAFMLPPALLPNFLCPAFLSISCLCSKSCSSSTLHGEILCKGRKPGWEWGWSCGRARGYWRRRWGQYRR